MKHKVDVPRSCLCDGEYRDTGNHTAATAVYPVASSVLVDICCLYLLVVLSQLCQASPAAEIHLSFFVFLSLALVLNVLVALGCPACRLYFSQLCEPRVPEGLRSGGKPA